MSFVLRTDSIDCVLMLDSPSVISIPTFTEIYIYYSVIKHEFVFIYIFIRVRILRSAELFFSLIFGAKRNERRKSLRARNFDYVISIPFHCAHIWVGSFDENAERDTCGVF